MHSKRTKERILRNKYRHKAWQNVERRKGDKAVVALVRSRVSHYVETRDAFLIAAYTRGFVDMPPHYETNANPPGADRWTTDPVYFAGATLRWQRSVLLGYPRLTIELIMACQKARREAGVIPGINSL